MVLINEFILEFGDKVLATVYVDKNMVIFPNGKLTFEELTTLFENLPFRIQFINSRGRLQFDSQNNPKINQRVSVQQEFTNLPHTFDILEKLKHHKSDKIERALKVQKRYLNLTYIALRNKKDQYLGCLRIIADITELIKKYKFGGFIAAEDKTQKPPANNYHYQNKDTEKYRQAIEKDLKDINTDGESDAITSASEDW